MSDKIFITGATGFIGSHLAELCVEKGYEVVAFDRYNPNNSWGWLEGSKYKKDIKIILGDVRDYDSVFKSMKGSNVVFHLAAYAAEGLSPFIRRFNYENNLIGSINLINLSIKHSVERFVFASSIAVYGSNQLPMKESLMPRPDGHT